MWRNRVFLIKLTEKFPSRFKQKLNINFLSLSWIYTKLRIVYKIIFSFCLRFCKINDFLFPHQHDDARFKAATTTPKKSFVYTRFSKAEEMINLSEYCKGRKLTWISISFNLISLFWGDPSGSLENFSIYSHINRIIFERYRDMWATYTYQHHIDYRRWD